MFALRSASALRPAVRAAPRLALAAPVVARRGVVTAAERWNEDDWHQAHALVKTGSVDLSRNIPDIEGKWESLGKPQQIATWVLLEDVMKKDWNEMTDNEKRAAWFIAYGPYGPRKLDPPHTRMKIFVGTVTAVCAGILLTMSVQQLGGAYLGYMLRRVQTDTMLTSRIARCQGPPHKLEHRVAGGYERQGACREERSHYWCWCRGLQGQGLRYFLPRLSVLTWNASWRWRARTGGAAYTSAGKCFPWPSVGVLSIYGTQCITAIATLSVGCRATGYNQM